MEKHLFNDEMYLILNKDGTQFRRNKRKIKPMIYHLPFSFITKEEYQDCKVAVFELKEIVTINQLRKNILKSEENKNG